MRFLFGNHFDYGKNQRAATTQTATQIHIFSLRGFFFLLSVDNDTLSCHLLRLFKAEDFKHCGRNIGKPSSLAQLAVKTANNKGNRIGGVGGEGVPSSEAMQSAFP